MNAEIGDAILEAHRVIRETHGPDVFRTAEAQRYRNAIRPVPEHVEIITAWFFALAVDMRDSEESAGHRTG